MADKNKVIERIKVHLFLTEEMKKRLLEVVEIANDEQMDELAKLLNREGEVVKDIIRQIMEKELATDNASSFIKEMKKLTQEAKLSVNVVKENIERKDDLEKAEELIEEI